MREMKPQEKFFADNFLESGNAEQAAIQAGYSARYARGNAHKLVARSCIKEYINARLQEITSNKIASATEVLEYFTRVMRGEEKDQFGLDVSIADRTAAAVNLGKRYGIFTENLNMTVAPVIVDDIPDE